MTRKSRKTNISCGNNDNSPASALVEDVVTLEDSWGPPRFSSSFPFCANEVSLNDQKFVTNLLNRLTNHNFCKLVDRLFDFLSTESVSYENICQIIVYRALSDPLYCRLYCNLVSSVSSWLTAERKDKTKELVTCFAEEVLILFHGILDVLTKGHNSIQTEDKLLQFMLQKSTHIQRRDLLGLCQTISELFKIEVVSKEVFTRIIKQLLSKGTTEISLECFCKLFICIGGFIDEQLDRQTVDSNFNVIEDLLNQRSAELCCRIRFLLIYLIEFRNNLWVSKLMTHNAKELEKFAHNPPKMIPKLYLQTLNVNNVENVNENIRNLLDGIESNGENAAKIVDLMKENFLSRSAVVEVLLCNVQSQEISIEGCSKCLISLFRQRFLVFKNILEGFARTVRYNCVTTNYEIDAQKLKTIVIVLQSLLHADVIEFRDVMCILPTFKIERKKKKKKG